MASIFELPEISTAGMGYQKPEDIQQQRWYALGQNVGQRYTAPTSYDDLWSRMNDFGGLMSNREYQQLQPGLQSKIHSGYARDIDWGINQGFLDPSIRDKPSLFRKSLPVLGMLAAPVLGMSGAFTSGAGAGAGAATTGSTAAAAPWSTGINLGGMGATGAAASTTAGAAGTIGGTAATLGGSGSGLFGALRGLGQGARNLFMPSGGAGTMSTGQMALGGLDIIGRLYQGRQLENISEETARLANPMNQPQRQPAQQLVNDYLTGKLDLSQQPMIKANLDYIMKQTEAKLAQMGLTGSGQAGIVYQQALLDAFNRSAMPYLEYLSGVGGFNQGPNFPAAQYAQTQTMANAAPWEALQSLGNIIQGRNRQSPTVVNYGQPASLGSSTIYR